MGTPKTKRKWPQISSFFPSEFCAGFIHLLYPNCALPATGTFHSRMLAFVWSVDKNNSVRSFFTLRQWVYRSLLGRLLIQYGVAGFHLSRKNPIHRAIHKLKYHNKPEIAEILGRESGKSWNSQIFNRWMELFPYPFTRLRNAPGYNQSLFFAKDWQSMQIPVYSKALERKKFTATQTKRTGWSDLKMWEKFCHQTGRLTGRKHLLLVDDVMTTGLHWKCGQQLLQVQGASSAWPPWPSLICNGHGFPNMKRLYPRAIQDKELLFCYAG